MHCYMIETRQYTLSVFTNKSMGITMYQSEISRSHETTQSSMIKVILPIDKCPKVKNRYINDEGKAEVYLISKTTSTNALEGNNIYALSGVKGLIVNNRNYDRIKFEMESYLNNRFGDDWEIRLDPISTK